MSPATEVAGALPASDLGFSVLAATPLPRFNWSDLVIRPGSGIRPATSLTPVSRDRATDPQKERYPWLLTTRTQPSAQTPTAPATPAGSSGPAWSAATSLATCGDTKMATRPAWLPARCRMGGDQ